MGTVPFHETGQQETYGVSEDCKFNDHPMCRSPRCGCSCHRQARSDGPTSSVSCTDNSNDQRYIPHAGLDKYCPVCKVKAASEQNFCTADGAKLSSLRCPECGTPGEQSHLYCGYCGAPMKDEDRLMEAAATGNRLPVDSAEIPAGDIDAEAAMRVAMGEVAAKTVPAPRVPKISMGMFK